MVYLNLTEKLIMLFLSSGEVYLAKLGSLDRPVLLKRGLSATIDDLLAAAEHILAGGNRRVILCERGVRTFEPWTRNTFDLSAIPVLRKMTHLPIIADPSHGTGKWEYVESVTKASVAAGADGFMVDVHPAPETALVDGAQAILPDEFAALMDQVRALAAVMNLEL